ncbi:MAG: cytochrome oxidase putative small subunit CydP [Leptothrix sp. (in: b-proteobacteria)]
MSRDENRLLRHLITAVVIKLAVLTLLWWAFVRDDRPAVDAEQAAQHLGSHEPTRAVGTNPGEPR